MSDPNAPPPKKTPAERFREIADRIDLNTGNARSGFGGAFLIVPPDGVPAEAVLITDASDVAMFWGLVKAKMDIALAELDQAQRQGGYGQRR